MMKQNGFHSKVFDYFFPQVVELFIHMFVTCDDPRINILAQCALNTINMNN